LGDGTVNSHLTPFPVASTTQFVGVSAGFDHSCAWTATGATYCWGGNLWGQVGDGTSSSSLIPRLVQVP
jgi:alpha-tubulin suppressor-like RCC1 family protein